jgi:hypothetical protein
VACHFPLPDEAPAAAAGALGADQLAAGDPRPLDPAPRAG